MSLLLILTAAPSGAMSGTAGITFGGSGTLTGTGALAGAAAIAFGQSGTLSGAGALSGTATLTLGASGTLTGLGALAGSAQITFGASGELTGSGAAPVVEQPGSGGYAEHGFYFEYERHQTQRRRRKRDEDERKADADAIQATLDREIAQLLHAQEAKDAERAELQRLQRLADDYAGTRQPVPKRVSTALLKAYEERSRNALEQLQREVERMMQEEELALMLLLNQ